MPLHCCPHCVPVPGQLPWIGVAPVVSATQVPTVPLWLHAWHAPLQATLQQTPSTQLTLWHWLLAVHAAPLDFLVTHAPPLQKSPEAQFASTEQVVGQLVLAPLQTYGVHDGLAPALPEAETVHVPAVVLQLSQPPVHALSQQ